MVAGVDGVIVVVAAAYKPSPSSVGVDHGVGAGLGRCLNFMTVGLAFVIQKISRLGHTYSLLFYFNLLNFRGVSKI